MNHTYIDLLRKLDIPADFEKTLCYLSDEEKDFLDLFLEWHSIASGEEVVAIAPGGGGYLTKSVVGKCFVFDKMLKNRYFVFINRWVLTLRFCKTDPFKVSALS